MKRYITTLALALLAILSTFGQTETTDIKTDHYKTTKFDVAIFPASYIDLIPGKRFTPTRQEIDKAETALRTELKELNKQLINQHTTPIIHKKLKKYKRQYFGYIDNKGNKILRINCFWDKDNDSRDNWLKDRISVQDGGSYYWNIKFNLNTGKLFDLQVNGYA